MKNKKVRQSFDDVAFDHWNYPRWVDNSLINGWVDYRDGNLTHETQKWGRKYVSLTADQLKEVK